MRPSVPDVHITDSQDEEFAAYRPLCGLSFVALFVGILAPLALAGRVFWLIPVFGVVIAWLALHRINAAAPNLKGRTVAVLGAALSLIFLAAAPTERFVSRKLLYDEARDFAEIWFRCLAQDEPDKAHQLTVSPVLRRPLNASLWSYYRNTKDLPEQLGRYANGPVVRTLLALGPRARVRFYQTVSQDHMSRADVVQLCYAVTFEEHDEKTSFFVLLHLRRDQFSSGRAGWSITQAQGGYRPEGW
jgi:hypothetical protein